MFQCKCGGLIIILLVGLFVWQGGSELETASAQPPGSVKYMRFEKWGVAFEYPQGWEEHPADRVNYMKEAAKEQLKSFSIILEEYAVIDGPNEMGALMISKSKWGSPITVQGVFEERQQVYRDAQAAGDVTKINLLEQITVDNKPAVLEDVERSSGLYNRGRTIKVISGETIIEISLIAEKSEFENCKLIFDHIINTLKIK